MFHKLRRVCQHWVGAASLCAITSSAVVLLFGVVFLRHHADPDVIFDREMYMC